MLMLSGVTKAYRTEEMETVALDALTLTIQPGEFAAVVGPSGCGKSTLLNVVGLLDAADDGRFSFFGHDIVGLPEAKLAALRKRHIGFVFQSFNLIEDLTVAENVEVGLMYHGVAGAERRARVAAALERVGIAHRARHRPTQLSGGQQQRVALARAVVSCPPLILADEPTGNLDTANGEEVMALLEGLNEAGTTVVMVTHSPEHAARARRVIRMLDGHIVSETTHRAEAASVA